MSFDPRLSTPQAGRNGSGGWLRRVIFGEQKDDPVAELPRAESTALEQQTLDALAEALGQLVAAARAQLDGASALCDRSADEARAYVGVLAEGTRTLDAAALPDAIASVVIQATQTMLARTLRAESNMRAMSADLAKLRDELDEAQTLATCDPLTGLPNRRALDKALEAAIAGAAGAAHALSLAFCDIDNFKELNDRHGHALGDRVLRLVGDCLADGGGQDVFVGRHGGEEFVMVFDGVGAEQAAIRVDAVRAKLATRTLRSKTDDSPIGNVTFSAGVAMLREGEGGEDLLRRADRALYSAKHKGKNRVEIDREE